MSRPPLLIFLSRANLADRLFCKDFFAQMGRVGPRKALILHDNTGTTPEDAHFASKRISAQLSEQMVTAMAMPAAQRKLFPAGGFNTALVHTTWQQLDVVVSQLITPDALQPAAVQLIPLAAAALHIPEVWLFASNPLSALGLEAPLVNDAATHARLAAAFPEELATLDLALAVAPARICNVQQLG
ncbi:MAG: hypothetical protein KF690_06325 [Bacteroidetes bacterium]|nr:hypothetical protein [Bacteroidota bacterium]